MSGPQSPYWRWYLRPDLRGDGDVLMIWHWCQPLDGSPQVEHNYQAPPPWRVVDGAPTPSFDCKACGSHVTLTAADQGES